MERETERFNEAIASSVERVVACLDGLSNDAARWAPGAPNANSLPSIANHVIANAERNVLATYCGLPYQWDRDAEFLATDETPATIRARWTDLRMRIAAALGDTTSEGLVQYRTHPRLGSVPGREVLLQAARHAAEHVGEAELTRALLLAAQAGPRTG